MLFILNGNFLYPELVENVGLLGDLVELVEVIQRLVFRLLQLVLLLLDQLDSVEFLGSVLVEIIESGLQDTNGILESRRSDDVFQEF
jgi:hypothetical protein